MITTLVPAFKPEHFLPLLTSLAEQRRKAERVIISDDSGTDAFLQAALQNDRVRALLKHVNGRILRGPKRGYHDNVRHLLAEYRKQPTEFFHILLDDDEIAPAFYEDHMRAHGTRRTLCCVSRRYIFHAADRRTSILAIPETITGGSTGMAQVTLGQMVRSFVVDGMWNWLGELSCMTLRRAFLDLDADFNTLDGIGLEGLNDVGTLIKSATVAEVVFLTEPKGLFRVHGNSISARQGYFYSLSILAVLPLAILLRRRGQLSGPGVAAVANRVRSQWLDLYGHDAVHARLGALLARQRSDEGRFEQDVLAFWAAYRSISAMSGALATREALMDFLARGDPFAQPERASP